MCPHPTTPTVRVRSRRKGRTAEYLGQRDVAAEEHWEAALARRAEHLDDPPDDLRALGQLARYACLHVVDPQRHTPRVADVLQRARYPSPQCVVLHGTLILTSCPINTVWPSGRRHPGRRGCRPSRDEGELR